MINRSVRAVAACAIAIGSWLWTSTALGQVQEYTLDDDRGWSEANAPDPDSDEGVINEARRLLADDRPREARRVLTKWIDEHDDQQNEWLAEAYLLRGDALVAINREFRALYDYERVLKGFWGSDAFPIAASRELDIAIEYVNGKRMRIWGMRIADASEIAVELLIRVQERLPGSELAEKAAIELADYYYRTRDMKLARDAYDLYLQNFPNGQNALRASQRLIQTDLARFKGPRYDGSGLLDARVRIQDFIRRYPAEADLTGINEALIVRIDESLAAQLLDTGRWYLKRGDWPSARLTLRRLVRDHPMTVAARRAEEIMEARGWTTAPQDEQVEAEESADTEVDEGEEAGER